MHKKGALPSRQQKQNLDKLINYVMHLPQDVFDMSLPWQSKNNSPGKAYMESRAGWRGKQSWLNTTGKPSYLIHERVCGTVGSFLGHGPDAGISPLKDIYGNYKEDWLHYAVRSFWFDPFAGQGRGDEYSQHCFQWLFDPRWVEIDNTPRGAAKRGYWLRWKGLPENWEKMLTGQEAICYGTWLELDSIK